MNLRNLTDSNNTATYRIFLKPLYFSIGLFIFAMFIVGVVVDFNMPPIPPSPKIQQWIDIHKSMGLTFLLLMIVHFVGRLLNSKSKRATDISSLQNRPVKLICFLLYFCLFATAIIGWAMAAFGGYITYFWGGPNMSLPLTYNPSLHIATYYLHKFFGWAIAILVFLYAVILIWYRYIKDNKLLEAASFSKES